MPIKAKPKLLPALIASFQKADLKLKELRKNANIESRIKTYLEIANALDGFVKKLEAGS